MVGWTAKDLGSEFWCHAVWNTPMNASLDHPKTWVFSLGFHSVQLQAMTIIGCGF